MCVKRNVNIYSFLYLCVAIYTFIWVHTNTFNSSPTPFQFFPFHILSLPSLTARNLTACILNHSTMLSAPRSSTKMRKTRLNIRKSGTQSWAPSSIAVWKSLKCSALPFFICKIAMVIIFVSGGHMRWRSEQKAWGQTGSDSHWLCDLEKATRLFWDLFFHL